MTQINLLPWREKEREDKKRHFFVILGGAVVTSMLIMILSHVTFEKQIGHQLERNTQLEKEIKVFDRQIAAIAQLKKTKAALIARMKIIQELQANRPQAVHLFDEIVRVLPQGVHLSKIIRKGDIVTLVGQAESNTNVSDLMRNIEASRWLVSPILSEIKKDGNEKNQKLNAFSLQMVIINPNAYKEPVSG